MRGNASTPLEGVDVLPQDEVAVPAKEEDSNGSSSAQTELAAPAGPPAPGKPDHTSPPPNGGLLAWLHVLGGFMMFFNCWGILNAFGVFQTYYESGELFVESSSNISWIGAIQSFMLLFTGLFIGQIYDRGYLRALILSGAFLVVFGHMMLSLCTNYWEVLLAQGFCVGIGAGCLFIPTVSVLPTYFSTKLGLAIGLASSGSSLGGVIYPVVLDQLLGRIGFAWSVRVMGFIALGTLAIPLAIMRMRIKAGKVRAILDTTAFTEVPYMTFIFGSFLSFTGLATTLFYVSFYSVNKSLTDSSLGFYVLAIYNAASCFGRTVPNAIADKIGPFNVLGPCTIIFGIVAFCLLAVQNSAGIIVLCVLSGFFSGVLVALPPVCLAMLTKDKRLIGTRIGQGFGMIGCGMLVGGPGAGAILGNDFSNWMGVWVFTGVVTFTGGLIYLAIRFMHSGVKIIVKV